MPNILKYLLSYFLTFSLSHFLKVYKLFINFVFIYFLTVFRLPNQTWLYLI
jgi:hypothetical protein